MINEIAQQIAKDFLYSGEHPTFDIYQMKEGDLASVLVHFGLMLMNDMSLQKACLDYEFKGPQ